MKILHVSGSSVWGGNEQQLLDLASGLKKINVENEILGISNSPLMEKARALGFACHELPNKKKFYFNYAKCLKQVIEQSNPDVVHLHTSNSATFYVIADIFYKLNKPAVYSRKGVRNKKSSWFSQKKYNYSNIKKVICVSKAVSEAFKFILEPKNHHRLVVVYDGIRTDRAKNDNPLNLRDTYAIPKDRVLMGNIAVHNIKKDLVTLMNAMNILFNEFGVKNIHLVQIGTKNKYTEEFTPLIDKYGLKDNITITGYIDNAFDLINQMDVFVMSSWREGLPLTIYEAFLNKVPVVSTKAGGVAEAIEHEYNGLLAEVKDARQLAMNLRDLLSNPQKPQLFVERSYELLFEKFTADQCAINTLKVYEEVICENSSSNNHI